MSWAAPLAKMVSTPGRGGETGGVELGGHSAAPARVERGAAERFYFPREGWHFPNEGGVGIEVGVAGEESLGLSEDYQQVGVHYVGDHGGEGVVVAYHVAFQFVHGNDVVFVDDRYDPVSHESQQGVAYVEVSHAVAQVFAREQGLGDSDVMPVEKLLVGVHEPALAYGGQRLAHEDVSGLSGGIEDVPSGCDRSRGHQQHLASAPLKTRYLADDAGHRLQVEAIGSVRNQRRAYLDHDAAVWTG